MMHLYKRNYFTLTPDEEAEWESLKQKAIDKKSGFSIRKWSFLDYPKAARHYVSLFPNNYLDIMELRDTQRLKGLVKDLRQIIDSKETKERDIISYLKQNEAYFIIGSLLKSHYHRFGHHEAFVFPEFQLGNSFKADYLIVGRGSGGYEFILVELEAPYGKITLTNGDLGEAFRKGLNQIEDWDSWIDSNFTSLKETFDKYKKPDDTLPEEFTHLDKSRIHYVVIAGQRSDFNKKTYRNRRKSKTLILHYDNLLDSSENIIGKNTY